MRPSIPRFFPTILSWLLPFLAACTPASPPDAAVQPPVVVVPGEEDTTVAGTPARPAVARQRCEAPGALCGTVFFTGTPPTMVAPAQRDKAVFCDKDVIAHNAVVVTDGRLDAVAVRVVSGIPDAAAAPSTSEVKVRRRRCVHLPRVAAAMVGQTLLVHNEDGNLHNVHGYGPGGETWFNRAQPTGAEPVAAELDTPGVYSIIDDFHPWEHGFVVVSRHRFFDVTREDGAFTIEGLPPGTYGVEAWHSIYGTKSLTVTVEAGKSAGASFTYDGKEPMAPENPAAARELKSFH